VRSDSVSAQICSIYGCDTNSNGYIDELNMDSYSCGGSDETYYPETSDSEHWTGSCAEGVEDDFEYQCDTYGCDCDGDGYIESGNDPSSALAYSLCVAEPGSDVAGNTAWCSSQTGTWYASDSRESDTEECALGEEQSGSTRSVGLGLQRSAEMGDFAWWKPWTWF
jgi:hypothetical protein